MEKIENLILKAREIAEFIKDFSGDIRLITHYDADGITSASIMVRTLSREGKDFHLTFLKQLLEKNLKELSEKLKKTETPALIIFMDFGSGQLEAIKQHIIKDNVYAVILDHHQMQGSEIIGEAYKNLFHLNPVESDITENVSGAGVTYIVARAMNPENKDLSELAIIGAIGDSQVGSVGSDWGLSGLNKEILKDAQKTKKITVEKGLRLWGRSTRPIHKALEYSFDPYIPEVSGSESGSVQLLKEVGIELKNENGGWRTLDNLSREEQKRLASSIIKERIRSNEKNPDWIFGDVYTLTDKKEIRDANEFATLLNATGKLKKGYLGVSLCLNDFKSLPEVKRILESYRREIGKGLRWLEENRNVIKKTENANYVLAGDNISEHVISNVTSIIANSNFLPGKPVFAFVNTDDGSVKISARTRDNINLKVVIVEIVKEIGGEGGGHSGAAGATIPLGSEERFINHAEKILESLKKGIEDNNGKTRGEESGRENEENRREGEEKAKESGNNRESGEKMERKGLVRYFNS